MKLQLIEKIKSRNTIERVFQLTFVSTDNYATGGVTLDFTKMVNSVNADRGQIPAYSSGSNPPPASKFRILQVPQGYDAEIIIATSAPTLKNYLFLITSSGGTQLSASGIPSGIYNDVNGFTFSCVTPLKQG